MLSVQWSSHTFATGFFSIVMKIYLLRSPGTSPLSYISFISVTLSIQNFSKVNTISIIIPSVPAALFLFILVTEFESCITDSNKSQNANLLQEKLFSTASLKNLLRNLISQRTDKKNQWMILSVIFVCKRTGTLNCILSYEF